MGTDPDGDDVDGAAILLSGELGDISSVVIRGAISLSFGTGRTKAERKQVLVPFMTCQLEGEFGKDCVKEEPSTTLTFDNVAFLFMQLGEQYLGALDALEAVSAGGLGPSPVRLDCARKWLQEGADALSRASERLGELAVKLTPAEDEAEWKSIRSDGKRPTTPGSNPRGRKRVRVVRP
jgi:hypothetical protein